jgi:hypothetical protein
VALNLAQALLLALAWVAIGLGPVTLLLRSLPLLPRLAWSHLVGVTLWGAGLLAGSHWLGLSLDAEHLRRLLLGGALAGGALAAITLAWRRSQARADTTTAGHDESDDAGGSPHLARWYVAVPLLLGVLIGAGLAAAAVIDPIADWDGRITWGAHARYVAAASTVDAATLRDARFAVAHPQYPPLLPLLQVTSLALHPDERAVKLLYVAFWPLLLVLLWDGVRRLVRIADDLDEAARASGRTPRDERVLAVAGVAVLFAMSLPYLAFFPDGGAMGAYSDLPLACLAGGAALLLLDDDADAKAGLLAGVLLAGVALAKNEGAFLAPAVLLGAGGALLVHRRQPTARARRGVAARRLLLAVPPWLAAVALLWSWRAGIPNRLDEDYAHLATLARLRAGLPHLLEIVALAVRQALVPRLWLLAWPLVFLGVLAGVFARRWREPWFAGLLVVVASAAAADLLAYLVTSWPLAKLVPVTAGRFLLQLVLPLLLLAAPALARTFPPPRG